MIRAAAQVGQPKVHRDSGLWGTNHRANALSFDWKKHQASIRSHSDLWNYISANKMTRRQGDWENNTPDTRCKNLTASAECTNKYVQQDHNLIASAECTNKYVQQDHNLFLHLLCRYTPGIEAQGGLGKSLSCLLLDRLIRRGMGHCTGIYRLQQEVHPSEHTTLRYIAC